MRSIVVEQLNNLSWSGGDAKVVATPTNVKDLSVRSESVANQNANTTPSKPWNVIPHTVQRNTLTMTTSPDLMTNAIPKPTPSVLFSSALDLERGTVADNVDPDQCEHYPFLSVDLVLTFGLPLVGRR
jgi:hypothetical protein